MRTQNINIVSYDKKWKDEFNKISAELEKALGKTALKIEHVGSTSVEGMASKPIIDVDIVVENDEKVKEAIEKLAKVGYEHEGNLGIKDREAFKYEGKEHLMEHHIYVCKKDSEELKRHLEFRDYLRQHPEEVKEYSAVKEKAAVLYPHNIEGYAKFKMPVIERIYAQIDD